MDVAQKHIDEIRDAFSKLKTKRDLLSLLNRANFLLHGERAEDFELKSLTYYSNPRIAGDRYTSFLVNKKSGGERVIHAPVDGLKALQTSLNLILQCVHTPHKAATGFVKDKSIVDNARKHVGKHYVFNTDLKDFFPSIDQARFWGRLKYPPFNLNEENENLEIANRIAALCGAKLKVERKNNGEWSEEEKFVLPQGAPTSPTVSNIIAERLDHKLTGVAKRFGCTYTRYADDLTFSSMHNIYKEGSEFREELKRVVNDQNFYINDSKTRLIEDAYRQEVTGLIVNEKVNVNRRYVKNLRMWLYYWEKYGHEKASKIFKKDYQEDKGHVKKGDPNFKNVLYGKLQFMKMVKGETDNTYKKLYKRYKKLTEPEQEKGEKERIITLDDVLVTSDSKDILSVHKEEQTEYDSIYPIKHDPQKLVDILAMFSDNENPLKYATHSWDSGRFQDHQSFKRQIRSAYNEIHDSLERLSKRLKAKIGNFLFNSNLDEGKWGFNNIKVGWSSPELANWCRKNPKANPLDFPIPEKYRKAANDVRLNTFRDVVNQFKHEIEVREEGNRLKRIVGGLLEKHNMFFDFEIQRIGLEQKRFFTDVQWFKNTLERIFINISDRSDYKVVEIKVENYTNSLVFKVIHKGSLSKSNSYKKSVKFKKGTGDLGVMINNMTNLADFSIETEFEEGPTRLNYLSSNAGKNFSESIESVEGFTHILKFYKPSE